MQEFKVSDLIPHEKNEFYFDEMSGQKWAEFLESVRTSGVIEPPVVTDKRVIVSGHQRVRACKELGIDAINCEVRIYDSEDRVLKDLIETNIRQRGTIGGSDQKMRRIMLELERIYGIGRGGDRRSKCGIGTLKTQGDIAEDLGMSPKEYRAHKRVSQMIPELQNAVDDGVVSTTTACDLISKLSEEEQIQILENLPVAQKHTQAQVQQYIDQIRGLTEEKEVLAQEAVEACRAAKSNQDGKEYLRLQERLEAEREKSRKIYEDYQELRKKNDSTDAVEEATNKVKAEYSKLIDAQEKKIKNLEEELDEAKSIPVEHKPIRSIVIDEPMEDQAKEYYHALQNEVGGFLGCMEGFAIQKDFCSYLTLDKRAFIAESLRTIMNRCGEMIDFIKDSTKEAA